MAVLGLRSEDLPATSIIEAPAILIEVTGRPGSDKELDEAMTEHGLRVEDAVNETCPWSGKPVAADSLTRYQGAVVGFCNPGCRDKFEKAVRHFEDALQVRRVESAGNGE